jgi:hypothetical protein
MDRKNKWKDIDIEDVVTSLPAVVIDLGYSSFMNDKV